MHPIGSNSILTVSKIVEQWSDLKPSAVLQTPPVARFGRYLPLVAFPLPALGEIQ